MSIYCILLFNCLYIYNILNFCLYNVIYIGQGLRVGRWTLHEWEACDGDQSSLYEILI